MGQAKLRGTFEERKAQAIAAGRIPAIRRMLYAILRYQYKCLDIGSSALGKFNRVMRPRLRIFTAD